MLLEDKSHWEKAKEAKKEEWTINLHSPAYWEGKLQKKIKEFEECLKNKAYWERCIEDEITPLKQTRDAVNSGAGENYDKLYRDHLIMNQKSLETWFHKFPTLTWTINHPDFKEYVDSQRQGFFKAMQQNNPAIPQGVLNILFEKKHHNKNKFKTIEESMFDTIQKTNKESMNQLFGSFEEVIGELSYLQASKEFMRGDIEGFAHSQAAHEVATKLAADNMPEFFDAYKNKVFASIKQELEKKLAQELAHGH